MRKESTRRVVRAAYGKIAGRRTGCCGCGGSSEFARSIGYSAAETKAIPAEANLGLSCGNPTALASLKKGETVLDLGSGAGFDCFLAARRVGPRGKVIGVDMTPEMVRKAQRIARRNNAPNVEFRLGEIERLPVDDNSVDVVISNCVINLSPDKSAVFKEIQRVLRPGGRVAISDIALRRRLPRALEKSVAAYVGCVAGAVLVEEYERAVKEAGLRGVKVAVKGTSACADPDTKDPVGRAILDGLPAGESLDEYVASVYVTGHKPARKRGKSSSRRRDGRG